ncbi:imidazole glycerol phosphate synthase subunit HisH [Marinibactrum halimedae]|uniref:Imidazole glycerol phosphate synthase subunit HisH n=1 Tax=Marinibactrum halimedae TaxID=1444977 RepID=A0AA37WLN4_9GAMM|nr:imidazole glycerol phosphate synthase subunit HisH [Marinibactrum halimedae]MCD9459320.1 imidazole glycerol phosphate synthase subunit HisH [Marinibactrum halimedae]GLS25788.1 imidazole glycerol phosphate synthase subunit HisH [Marinibactrum halimedae]
MTQQTIAVVDYGMGNLHSVASALEHAAPDVNVVITDSAHDIERADRIVFPGVGAVRDCMAAIRAHQFDQLMSRQIELGKPVLGICVGMQVLLEHSEENNGIECMGLLPGKVKFFGKGLRDEQDNHLKVPHMGWNEVHQTQHPLWNGIEDGARFYFVHSYYVEAANSEQIAGVCEYSERFVAALGDKNLFAVQFHPEKSHDAGIQLLRNFSVWTGNA